MFKSAIHLIEKKAARRISTGEILGLQCDLSLAGGLKNLRICHETLPHGHRSSPPHRHTARDEFIYVLEGNPSLWIDGAIQQLKAEDFVALPPGAGQHHMLFNESGSDAKILLISSVPENDDDIIYLPELDKIDPT